VSKEQIERRTAIVDDQKPASAAQQLSDGHKLLAIGNVLGARRLYTLSFEAGLSEAAFALARSYDPRAIARLNAPNAQPDPDEARRWYRLWYRRSVDEGAISKEVKLEVLIGAMGRN